MSAITTRPDPTTAVPDPTLGRPDFPAGRPAESGPTRPDWVTAIGIAVVGVSAIALSFTSLTGLGRLVGWGRLDFLLPLTIDAYAITATRVWLTRRTLSRKVRRFAAKNAVGAILFSVAGNAVFHALTAKALVLGDMFWLLIVLVSAVPPIMIGLVSHMIALRARDAEFAVAETPAGLVTPDIAVAPPTQVDPTPPVASTEAPEESTDSPDPTEKPTPDVRDEESGVESGRVDSESGDGEVDPKLPEARALDEQWLREKGRHVGAETIRTELGVGQRRSRDLRDAVRGLRVA